MSTVITMCPSGDEMAVSCAFAEKQRSNAESMQKILVLMLGLFVVLSRIYSKMISVAKKFFNIHYICTECVTACFLLFVYEY